SVNSEQTQITNDDDKGIVNGQTVHRNEFGIKKGTYWSPSGKYLAFYRKDETMVTNYPLVDIETRIAQVDNIKYPMAGMNSEQVKLGIFNMNSKETVFVNTGEPADQYLTCVTWDPSEEYIYIALLNRDQNYLKLNKYDAVSGNYVHTLFEEQSNKYVEPEHPLYFLTKNPSQFIWMSEGDGYQHLYLYNTAGKLVKQLTSGNWVVSEFLGIDSKEKKVFFRGTKASPLEQNIYSVEIKSGKITRISPDHGTHKGIPSFSGEYMIDSYSSTDVAKEYKLLNGDGKVVRVLQENDDPLKDYNLGETSIFTIQSDDGIDLYSRIIKPMDFDPTKKYPVFFYVYGGPHSQLVNDSWLGSAGIFQNYMAQQGYVVFTMDNRGTANRGLEFEQAIFRNLGTLEVDDQMKGVEYLKSLDFVDPDRIGVDGWSYGGFLTISMMLKHPGVFKVGCAGGPVIDWKYYEIMYGERYMDTPKTNPLGYENANLLNLVDQLEDKLLILQGTEDNTVVWQNSLTFIKRCVDEGKQVDYFVYPGHKHNVRGKDRIHMYEKIRMYFDEQLKN
ncbi:MAG: S9 family peptidase, partial [Bacteroidales bacterium]|nr:S9 family peptidase [Bacteroidales bacterium]